MCAQRLTKLEVFCTHIRVYIFDLPDDNNKFIEYKNENIC